MYLYSYDCRIKATDAVRLQDEYAKLVEGLQDAAERRDNDEFMSNPCKPEKTDEGTGYLTFLQCYPMTS